MKMQIYNIDRYMIYIKLFAALKRRLSEAERPETKKEQPVGYPLFLKDGIEKIIIKDKQHLSFEYIIALILQKSKYNIAIAMYLIYSFLNRAISPCLQGRGG